MKKILLIFLLLIFALSFGITTVKSKLNKDLSQIVYLPTPTTAPTPAIVKNTAKATQDLFVPYWTIKNEPIDTNNFDSIIYFGITPTEQGINTDEQGYRNLDQFVQNLPQDQKKLLTLRMTNTAQNLNILKNPNAQAQIITQTTQLAKQNGFNGVVLDLEISAIPFDALIKQINNFVTTFNKQTKKENLTFSLTVYGDTFYRIRPFDIKTIAQNTDQIFIMAYDFHKAGGGSPGPNFPLAGREKYGYDLKKMADDFLQSVPPQKITVVFGLFGYDWRIDNKDSAIGEGTPLTDAQIQQKFLNSCSYANCHTQSDPLSAETQIKYTDDDKNNHIIWFEDQHSIKIKQQALKQKSINSSAFWAYSYF